MIRMSEQKRNRMLLEGRDPGNYNNPQTLAPSFPPIYTSRHALPAATVSSRIGLLRTLRSVPKSLGLSHWFLLSLHQFRLNGFMKFLLLLQTNLHRATKDTSGAKTLIEYALMAGLCRGGSWGLSCLESRPASAPSFRRSLAR